MSLQFFLFFLKKLYNLIKLGLSVFKILHIPGHTIDHILFFSEKAKVVFTGDTLFSLGCGRVFEGTHEQMFESLEKIKSLPKNTMVYCGHEYTYSNGKFCISIDNSSKLEVFTKLRNLKDQF